MRLVIDIGNTRAKLVVFDKTEVIEQTYSDSNTLSALDDLKKRYALRKGILSTVTVLGEEAEKRLLQAGFPIIRLDAKTPLPCHLEWRKPGCQEPKPLPPTMGTDRIAAIVGAMAEMPDTPLLIIDAGTCITYEVVDEEGYYLGGNIAPGLKMRLKAMHEHTALLPEVQDNGETPLLGYNTETSMRNGAVQGLQYEVEGYIHRWRDTFPTLQVFLTGGSMISFDPDTEAIIHRNNYLVPCGLNSILGL